MTSTDGSLNPLFFRDLLDLSTRMTRGADLTSLLDRFYEGFRSYIPYDRLGVSLITDDRTMVRSIWARSETKPMLLGKDYQAPLAGSTLETIVTTGRPRILNDLAAYLREKPGSHSTGLVVKEGMHSSLTCPLLADNTPIGFLFFSKRDRHAYADAHVDTFQQIAEHLSILVARTLDVERLRQLNDLKNKFLGIAAHDLRSPLAIVQSYLEMLQDEDVQRDSARKAHVQGRLHAIITRMRTLINDLLDISAIESGQLTLERTPTDLAAFLRESVTNHALTATAKNITVIGEIPPGLPAVNIDQRRFSQVLDNFISNAVKFSPKGTTVRVEAVVEGAVVRVRVIDQGQGIPAEEQAKLFMEFGRTSVKPTDGEKSTGLGLAIVKKIVSLHGGQVGVTSTVGVGSTFWFTLPLEETL
jgi:signal transduction histidine kinase